MSVHTTFSKFKIYDFTGCADLTWFLFLKRYSYGTFHRLLVKQNNLSLIYFEPLLQLSTVTKFIFLLKLRIVHY